MPKSLAAVVAKPEIATRYVGFCAACEGDFRLTDHAQDAHQHGQRVRHGDLVLVHHGFKRPGEGEIRGDCMCVAQVPYEVSCEPLRPYLRSLNAQKAGTR